MHGHHGWGWEHHCGGWGLGWLLPAILLGRVVSETVTRPSPWPVQPAPETPRPQPPPQPQPVSNQAKAALRCAHCDGAITSDFAYCPHCGKQVAPHACRYCGHSLQRDALFCPHCGGPAR